MVSGAGGGHAGLDRPTHGHSMIIMFKFAAAFSRPSQSDQAKWPDECSFSSKMPSLKLNTKMPIARAICMVALASLAASLVAGQYQATTRQQAASPARYYRQQQQHQQQYHHHASGYQQPYRQPYKQPYQQPHRPLTNHLDTQEEEEEERPRIRLGLRVRIPAFRFDLPRMSLPKITINAKFQQPNRPRTIRLPAINLDTSSRVSASNSISFGGESGASSGPKQTGGYYGNGQQHKKQPEYSTQSFAFSASQDDNDSSGRPIAYSSSQIFPLYEVDSNHTSSAGPIGYNQQHQQQQVGPSYEMEGQQGFDRRGRAKRQLPQIS